MWSSQGAETPADELVEFHYCIYTVLRLAQEYIHLPRKLRFILFFVFLAGCASTDAAQKQEALKAIHAFKQVSLIPNISTIVELLGLVYTWQDQTASGLGNPRHVDWLDVVLEIGLITIFGL